MSSWARGQRRYAPTSVKRMPHRPIATSFESIYGDKYHLQYRRSKTFFLIAPCIFRRKRREIKRKILNINRIFAGNAKWSSIRDNMSLHTDDIYKKCARGNIRKCRRAKQHHLSLSQWRGVSATAAWPKNVNHHCFLTQRRASH